MEYSIIIPHHNSSNLLERLLLSIEKNYSFQVIVVDDNSNEAEYNKLEELQKRDDLPVFELYKNEGKTAGGARNTGLKHAKGKWIIFADSDDYFMPAFYSLIEKYGSSDYDLIYFNVSSSYSDTGERAYRDGHIKTLIKKYTENNDFNYLRCLYLAPWGKMIKRELIASNNITFAEVPSGNDMWFSARTGIEANKICVDTNELYVITVSSGSLTTTLTKDRFNCRFEETLRVNNYIREHHLSRYQISVLYFILKSYMFGVKYMLHVVCMCFKNHSNIFIGLGKIFKYKSVIQDRQNPKFTVKQ